MPGEVEKDMWNGREQNGLWKGRCFNNMLSRGSLKYLNLNTVIYFKELFLERASYLKNHCKGEYLMQAWIPIWTLNAELNSEIIVRC